MSCVGYKCPIISLIGQKEKMLTKLERIKADILHFASRYKVLSDDKSHLICKLADHIELLLEVVEQIAAFEGSIELKQVVRRQLAKLEEEE